MSIKELYDLVKEYYGYKVKMKSIDSEKREIIFLLYDSFLLGCELDDQYGCFGVGIEAEGECTITRFLGESASLNSDEESIKNSLKIIDEYCRLRLPDRFLDAYCKNSVTDEYENSNL